MSLKKTQLPLMVTSIVALLMLVEYFFAVPTVVKNTSSMIQTWAAILASFAIGLGFANTLKMQLAKVRNQKKGYGEFLIIIGGTVVIFLIGLIQGKSGPTFMWMYNNVYVVLTATTFSLTAFFIISASFRALIS